MSALANNGGNRVKGICFHTLMQLVEDEFGAESVPKVAEACGGELARLWPYGGLLRGSWYPIEWYRSLHAAAQQVTGSSSSLARKIGRDSTYNDLSRGIYKVFVKIASPQWILSAASRIFNQYYEAGEMRIIDKDKGMARGRWSGCAGFDRNLWLDITGGVEGALKACGAEQINLVRLSGGDDGDDVHELKATWK